MQTLNISSPGAEVGLAGVPIREEVELRVSFNLKTNKARIRFWYHGRLVGQQEVKSEDLPKVHF